MLLVAVASAERRGGATPTPVRCRAVVFLRWRCSSPAGRRRSASPALLSSGVGYNSALISNMADRHVLDYDGTLSSIVQDPDSVVMTKERHGGGCRPTLPTAIMSGRCRDKGPFSWLPLNGQLPYRIVRIVERKNYVMSAYQQSIKKIGWILIWILLGRALAIPFIIDCNKKSRRG